MKEFKAPVRYNQCELLIAYLSGKPIKYSLIGYDTWYFVFPFQKSEDVARLSNKKYKFRIKPENT